MPSISPKNADKFVPAQSIYNVVQTPYGRLGALNCWEHIQACYVPYTCHGTDMFCSLHLKYISTRSFRKSLLEVGGPLSPPAPATALSS